MSQRPRHYAAELSEVEQQTLDKLRSRITPDPAAASLLVPTRAPRWRRAGYLSTAALVAALTMGSALVATRSRHEPSPAPVGVDRSAAAVDGLERVIAALDRPATSTAGNRTPRRRWLSVVVTRTPDGCRAGAVAVAATMTAVAPRRPPSGHLTVAPAALPRFAGNRSGCPSVELSRPGTAFDGASGDLNGTWLKLAAGDDRLARSPGPLGVAAALRFAGASLGEALRDARFYDAYVAKLCISFDVDCAAFAWTAAAELIADPATAPDRRVVAVRQAAAAGPATTVVADGPDVTGRAGVTLRVPYLRTGAAGFAGATPTTAELTFDPGTGALLQILVSDRAGDRVEVLVLEP